MESVERLARSAGLRLSHFTRCVDHKTFANPCSKCESLRNTGRETSSRVNCYFVCQVGMSTGVFVSTKKSRHELECLIRDFKLSGKDNFLVYAANRGFQIKTVGGGGE